MIIFLRKMPLLLWTALGGTGLILVNPGYFWDDWVWLYQSKESAMLAGRELGIWWGGYATNVINSLNSPAAGARVLAFIFWIIAGLAFVSVFRIVKILSKEDLFITFIFVICAPFAVIRFTTSVAFYYVYIASFCIGILIILKFRKNITSQLVSAPFLFFSFYLNSLIFLFILMLVVIYFNDVFNKCAKEEIQKNKYKKIVGLESYFSKKISSQFIKNRFILLFLPLFFYLTKYLLQTRTDIYENYNLIDFKNIGTGFIFAIYLLLKVLVDQIVIIATLIPIQYHLTFIAVTFLLVKIAFLPIRMQTGRVIIYQIVIALALFIFSVYPYILVNKPPKINDFTESRHILPAILGLSMLLTSLTNAIKLIPQRNFAKIRRLTYEAFISLIIGLSISFSVFLGISWWRDYALQLAIIDFIKNKKNDFNKYGKFIIVDNTSGVRILNRNIWNYEYTGYLQTIYSDKNKLAISQIEYKNLPVNAKLLNKIDYKIRYNIENYNIFDPGVIFYIKNRETLTAFKVLNFVFKVIGKHNLQNYLDNFFVITQLDEVSLIKLILPSLEKTVEKLEEYKLINGHYPVTPRLPDGIGDVSSNVLEENKKPLKLDYIPDINDKYGIFIDVPINEKIYIKSLVLSYQSNGEDFKLLIENPLDYYSVKQTHPFLIDVSKPSAYGFWTEGAVSW